MDFTSSIKLGQQIADCILQSQYATDLGTISRALRFADEILAEECAKKFKVLDLSQIATQSSKMNLAAIK